MNPAVAEAALRRDLARGDAVLESVGPVLRHLLGNDGHSIFSDEIIASMRGMLADLAQQLVSAVNRASGSGGNPGQASDRESDLLDRLVSEPDLLAHVHALALEAHLAARLEARLGLDPVLSPLLQALIGSNAPEVSSIAMGLLAAQARFVQHGRRMQLPLGEMPGDLLHIALLALRDASAQWNIDSARVAAAESEIRPAYDESRSRLGLISRLVTGLGGGVMAALSVSHAGAAIFLSALSVACGQDRDAVVLATHDTQATRLGLALRAAGLKSAAIAEQLEALHPDLSLSALYEQLGPEQAAALLAGTGS